ncbi:MAG: bifunctional DNA-formamidopyrimidine glycosylase/DNA-(apurinic or apyrimidinic site) lyase, partial [Caulobacteraceae bacterium]|nr:bifunctional DNA-formamidopyrimidine glycosylase/DNA-(apurinic or apyrimidinic site) lyase [Caulobacteraceae bacterium]
MPELPEVETVRRGLETVLAGARLTHVEARRPDLRFPLPAGFAHRLAGARVLALTRRGKYILAPLDRGETWIIHLGMTGRFDIVHGGARAPSVAFALAAPTDDRHVHIVIETDAGARVTYADARRFGFMDLVPTAGLAERPPFADLGPEPLGGEFDGPYLMAAFRGRRQTAKTLLLDQRIVAGLGNIYVNEALHRARVSPLRAAGELDRRAAGRIAREVKAVLAEAIAAGGSTLRDFAAADGSLGYFQHRFRVYGRSGEACPRQGCRGEIERTVQAGRSTFHCPKCQP